MSTDAPTQALYTALIEAISDAVIVQEDDSERFTLVNPAAERLLGYSRSELLECGYADVSAPDALDRVMSIAEALYQRGEWQGTCELRRKDGTPIVAEVAAARLQVGGRVVYQAVLREAADRTRRRQVARSGPRRITMTCAVCDRVVEGTVGQRYCSDACRQRAFYHRHLDAQRARSRERHRRRKAQD